jgi:hypothetical protein
MQSSLNRRLSTLERRYGPAMARPAMIGDMTSIDVIRRLSSSEREELAEVMRSLINGPCQEATKELGRIYLLARERKDRGLVCVRERKPPDKYREELREARLIHGPEAWQFVDTHQEYLAHETNQ